MVDKHEMMIRGIPASPGIAIGWAAVIVPESIIVPEEIGRASCRERV